jgi:hypothetical protein
MLSAVVMLLMLFGCGDEYPPPFQLFCSLPADGSQLAKPDNSLNVSALGKAFYISDDLVFHLGDRLVKHNLNTLEITQLLPMAFVITDKSYLAIDRQNQLLYFSADYAIYRIGFNGQGLTKLSPDGNGNYCAPALSTCGQYLTAIRDRHISRMDINTMAWIDLPEPDIALYAVYASDEDAYYYYFRHFPQLYADNRVGLSRFDPNTQVSTVFLSEYDMDSSGFDETLKAQVSESGRYFAMQFVIEPRDVGFMFGPEWTRSVSRLKIYDRITGQYIEIPDSFCYAFVPDGDILLYSHLKYGMADLMQMDLATRTSTMIWDGYYIKDFYSYAVTEIIPRDDGQMIHLNAWERSRLKIENNKSFTAPR